MNDVNSAVGNLSIFVSSESLKLFLGVFIPWGVKTFLFFIRKLFDIQYAEKNLITDRRVKTLTSIASMCKVSRGDAENNAIKALYEVINMHYPIRINEYILTFIRSDGIVYDNRGFQAFINSPTISDIQNVTVNIYNKIYRKQRGQRILFTAVTFFILLVAFILSSQMAKNSSGPDQAFFITLAVIFYLLAFGFSFFIMNKFEQHSRARQFFKIFSPWLEKKLSEEKIGQTLNC